MPRVDSYSLCSPGPSARFVRLRVSVVWFFQPIRTASWSETDVYVCRTITWPLSGRSQPSAFYLPHRLDATLRRISVEDGRLAVKRFCGWTALWKAA